MRVRDLIDILDNMDSEMLVAVEGYEGGVTDAVEVFTAHISEDVNEEWYYGEHEVQVKPGDSTRLVIRRGI